jgi:hypothetical protein
MQPLRQFALRHAPNKETDFVWVFVTRGLREGVRPGLVNDARYGDLRVLTGQIVVEFNLKFDSDIQNIVGKRGHPHNSSLDLARLGKGGRCTIDSHFNFNVALKHGLTGEDVAGIEFLAAQHVAEVVQRFDFPAQQLASAGPATAHSAVMGPVDSILEGDLQ